MESWHVRFTLRCPNAKCNHIERGLYLTWCIFISGIPVNTGDFRYETSTRIQNTQLQFYWLEQWDWVYTNLVKVVARTQYPAPVKTNTERTLLLSDWVTKDHSLRIPGQKWKSNAGKRSVEACKTITWLPEDISEPHDKWCTNRERQITRKYIPQCNISGAQSPVREGKPDDIDVRWVQDETLWRMVRVYQSGCQTATQRGAEQVLIDTYAYLLIWLISNCWSSSERRCGFYARNGKSDRPITRTFGEKADPVIGQFVHVGSLASNLLIYHHFS